MQRCLNSALPVARRRSGAREHKSIRVICIYRIAYNRIDEGVIMENEKRKLRPAQVEVHRTAHNQDLVEIPKRARLDREAEGRKVGKEIPVRDNQ
jgi:hypothetical protein